MNVPRTCTKWSIKTEELRRMYLECREWEIYCKQIQKFISQLNQKALERLAAATHVELMERDAKNEYLND